MNEKNEAKTIFSHFVIIILGNVPQKISMMIFIQLTSNNDGLKNQTLTVVSLTDFLLNGLLEKVRFLFLSEVQSCQTVLQGTTNPP